MRKQIKLFFAYAQEDKILRNRLEKHLSLLKRQYLIADCYERRICAGMQWELEVDRHLNSADIIFLLISSDFMASDYCYGIEMMRALERHEAHQAYVIPIILRPVDWAGAPFSQLQALPTGAKPIASSGWYSQDEAFTNVAKGIRKAIKEFFGEPFSSLSGSAV